MLHQRFAQKFAAATDFYGAEILDRLLVGELSKSLKAFKKRLRKTERGQRCPRVVNKFISRLAYVADISVRAPFSKIGAGWLKFPA